MTEAAKPDSEVIRHSIADRVRGLGGALGQASPTAMVVVLAGAALWPVVAPLVGTSVAASMVAGGVGLLGGPGQEFVSNFLKRLATRKRDDATVLDSSAVQAEFERQLSERLQGDGQEAAALRAEVSQLLRSVGGVESALAAASGEVKDALAGGLAEWAGTWVEFRWMLVQLEGRLQEIQERQAEGLALQREGLDLQRQQLIKTTLLLRLHTTAGADAPPEDATVDEVLAASDVVCPYMGLQAFQPEDTEFYFGREALVADVLARLAEARFVAVVGASGSGKSSFVRAGVVAAIWKGTLAVGTGARVIMMTPGERPLEQLAMRIALLRNVAVGSLLDDLRSDPRHVELAVRQALIDAPADARVVLVVDQFEELFTLCHDEDERRGFVQALMHVKGESSSRTIVILAVRADFYGRLAAFTELAAAVRDDQVLIGPMASDELRRAIEQPAAEAGLTVEPGLIDTILEDLGSEPGGLPLLSHALLETWDRRRGSRLTVAGYRESGGVRGAIAQTAESVVERLDPEQQAIARRIFLSLTDVGEGSEPTRRRVSRSELGTGPGSQAMVEQVIDVLADARLVTLDEQTVEVAHEALIRHWPRLRRWLDESLEELRLHRRLTQAAREWEHLGRDPGALYRGARLAAIRDWTDDHQTELSDLERDFVNASRAAESTELERQDAAHDACAPWPSGWPGSRSSVASWRSSRSGRPVAHDHSNGWRCRGVSPPKRWRTSTRTSISPPCSVWRPTAPPPPSKPATPCSRSSGDYNTTKAPSPATKASCTAWRSVPTVRRWPPPAAIHGAVVGRGHPPATRRSAHRPPRLREERGVQPRQ